LKPFVGAREARRIIEHFEVLRGRNSSPGAPQSESLNQQDV
jgi:hypothetical protein